MKFWKTKEKVYPKRGIDYEFVDDGAQHVTAVKILIGEFKDIIYHYGKVEVVEGFRPRLKFDYYIDNPGEHAINELHKSKKFDILMGDVLVSIFDDNVLRKEIEKDESSRVFNTEKSNL